MSVSCIGFVSCSIGSCNRIAHFGNSVSSSSSSFPTIPSSCSPSEEEANELVCSCDNVVIRIVTVHMPLTDYSYSMQVPLSFM